MFKSSFLSIGLHLSIFLFAFYGMPLKKSHDFKELEVEFVDNLPVSEKTKTKKSEKANSNLPKLKVPKTKPSIKSIKKKPEQKPKNLAKKNINQNLEKIPKKPKTLNRKIIKKEFATINKKPIKRPFTKKTTKSKTTDKKRNQTANSILKTLAEAENINKKNNKSKKLNEIKNNLLKAQTKTKRENNLDNTPSISEIDRIRNHVAQCYNVPYGTSQIDDKRIKLKIRLDTDGSVKSTNIIDKKSYQQNSLFRAAADAARRAVLDCSPLPIPIEKYEKFKVFIFIFSTAFINS